MNKVTLYSVENNIKFTLKKKNTKFLLIFYNTVSVTAILFVSRTFILEIFMHFDELYNVMNLPSLSNCYSNFMKIFRKLLSLFQYTIQVWKVSSWSAIENLMLVYSRSESYQITFRMWTAFEYCIGTKIY